jgi:hypothetical protein
MGQFLDFIEIGTSDYDTILESCYDFQKGISIEPLKFYLDNLPNRSNVVKINGALVSDKNIKTVKTYFIDPKDIEENGLEWWIRGCNSVGKPHDFHINYPLNYVDFPKWHWGDKSKIQTKNLLNQGIVQNLDVPCFLYSDILDQYDIEYVDLLKIDTEGQDASLLNSILDYYENSSKILPDTILFETNGHNKLEDSIQIIKRLGTFGYKLFTGEGSTDNFIEFDKEHLSFDCKAVLINKNRIKINKEIINRLFNELK